LMPPVGVGPVADQADGHIGVDGVARHGSIVPRGSDTQPVPVPLPVAD
jgi:hypothetical protein